ncbi:MAG: lipopolysaccharide heptosyltransferase II [Candidatus Omnitrophica bacterium]|nr:lipopolysaccharide heptosyltransferase II [Candidatus Omnitrophota bacterium]
MNILQLLPALDVGGVERGTVDFARYLMLHGHKSVVVSGGGKLVRCLDEVGARHYKLPVGKKSPVTILLMVRRLCEIINKENIEIVHARSRVPAIIGFLAAKFTNRTFITTAHGYYNTRVASRPMSWGRFVIVASHDMARHMREDFGTPYQRIKLIPRGVDLNEFKLAVREEDTSSRRKDFVIGMISRVTPLKGHTDFLKAVSIVARSVSGIKVLVVGEVPPSKKRYREELDLLVRRLGIANIVDFMGSREDIPDIISQLDVLVLPTKTPEAFGRVIIEAQAVGVPVVATKVGGIVDIIRDGENGLLVMPEDPHSIAEAILKVIKDRDLARSITAQARKDVEEKYSLAAMAEKTLGLYREALSLKNILVIKMGALGDVILSIPSLKAIRKKFPNSMIKVLVGLASSDAFRGCPYINERIVYNPDLKASRLKSVLDVAAKLRREDFDIVIDLQNNKKSHLISFLTMANYRYGYDNEKWSFFLNRRVKNIKTPMEPVEHQFRTLKLLGIERSDEPLEFWPSQEDEDWADSFLKENWMDPAHTLVGINIGASGRWQSKRWEADYIAQLCDSLAKKYNIRTLLTGVNKDLQAARDIVRATDSKPMISAGKTDILQLASLMKRCKVYITTDSAPLHVAASVGVPFIALFGPTDPKRHMPKADKYKLLTGNVKCSPCYKPSCGKKNKCMKRIKVDDVLAAVEGFLR